MIEIRPGGGGGGGVWAVVRKTADQTKTSDAVAANDSALVITLAAATTYLIRGRVFISGTVNTGYRIALSYSGSTTAAHQHFQTSNDEASGVNSATNLFSGSHNALFPNTAISMFGTRTASVFFEVAITTGTSGTFGFQWAQNTSSPDATICRRGSYLEWMVT